MVGYDINWVGWNNNDNHDKVWGWLQMSDERVYCFWGRRGKKLRFKEHSSTYRVITVQHRKEKEGYNHIVPTQYDTLVKDFIDEVEIWCTTAILEDSVM